MTNLILQKQLSDWVKLYTEELYSWAFYKVSNQEIAKDLVQDTFLVASTQIESFKAKSLPKTWLFAILNRKIIDFYRNKFKLPFSLDDDVSDFFDKDDSWKENKAPESWNDDVENLLDNKSFLEVLKMCLDILPEKWNSIIRLKYLLNKNGKEICQELEINPTNYWQVIHRAKLQLRSCIESNWFKKQ